MSGAFPRSGDMNCSHLFHEGSWFDYATLGESPGKEHFTCTGNRGFYVLLQRTNRGENGASILKQSQADEITLFGARAEQFWWCVQKACPALAAPCSRLRLRRSGKLARCSLSLSLAFEPIRK